MNCGLKCPTFHFHVCPNCFYVLGHEPKSPEPCSYHDCPKCGEEVDRDGFVRRYDAAQEVKRLKELKQ